MRSHSCHRDPATPVWSDEGQKCGGGSWRTFIHHSEPWAWSLPWPMVHSAIISIHYLQKLEGLISHGGDSLPLLDFTQTQRPGRINRINSLLETEADSSLKSAEYKLLEFFSFDINIQILWHRHNSVKKRWWNSTTASWEEHLTQTKFSKIYYASDTKTKAVLPSFCCLWFEKMWRKIEPGQPSTQHYLEKVPTILLVESTPDLSNMKWPVVGAFSEYCIWCISSYKLKNTKLWLQLEINNSSMCQRQW